MSQNPTSPVSNETAPPRADDALDQLSALLALVQTHQRTRPTVGSLTTRLADFLGDDLAGLPVVEHEAPPHRFADFDIALAEIDARDPGHDVVGVGGPDYRHHASFSDMVQDQHVQFRVTRPEYVSMPISADSSRSCVGFGIHLLHYQGVPMAVLQRRANPRNGREGQLDVMCGDSLVAQEFLAEVEQLALSRSVLRGQVVGFKSAGYDRSLGGIVFERRPGIAADEVILPEGTLARISAHVLGIAAHSEFLRAHGQHLKRGVLLYGPPGTGKTHTLRHLISEARDHTVVLLSGETLEIISFAVQVARALQPAIVVLEDVDLIAEDRQLHPGAKPLLFEVMDAMDGLDGDADVTFLLTTNQVETMERALTQRPGRVDLAAEIPLPDQAGRRRLLRLYAPAGAFTDAAIETAAARLEGTTASMAKELMRRAVLLAAAEGVEPTDAHLVEATDVLLSDTEVLSRALLGDQSARPRPEAFTPFDLHFDDDNSDQG